MRKLTSALLIALLGAAGILGLDTMGGGDAAGDGNDWRIRALRAAGGEDAAAAAAAIRLPSDDDDDGWDVPPWKCCDFPSCSPSSTHARYPTCLCADLVDSCDGCTNCSGPIESDPPRFLCGDRYRTYPPPRCTPAEERPWACCDHPKCTRTCPTICTCDDAVESCAAACKDCRRVEGADPPRFRCLDSYVGSPWPSCKALEATKMPAV